MFTWRLFKLYLSVDLGIVEERTFERKAKNPDLNPGPSKNLFLKILLQELYYNSVTYGTRASIPH